MGDPLSVAGTAVGVVSLGLQVTGGLIKYYSNFRSYHDDIAQITQSLERLCELLEYLKDVLKKEELEHSAVLIQVRRSVSACEGGLRFLKREVEKNRTVKLPVNTEDKARIIAKRLLYPFKKETLQDVQLQLYALEDRLSFAVNLWNREIGSSTFEVVTVIGRATQRIDRKAQSIDEKLDKIVQKMASLNERYRIPANLLKISIMEAPTSLQHEPALLSTLCQERDQLVVTYQQALRRNHKRTKVQYATTCFCPSQTRRLQGPSRRFNWYSFSSAWVHTTHLPNCPLSRYGQQRSDLLDIKYTYCTRLLGFSVVANLSVKGGGRFPNLNSNIAFRAVVPPESPAFQLLHFSETELGNKAGFTTSLEHAEWILQQLEILFRTGKAHPRDVLPNGMTLLHCAMRGLNYRSSKIDNVLAVSHLVQGIMCAGAEPILRDDKNRTILEVALKRLAYDSRGHYWDGHVEPGDHVHGLLVRLLDNDLAIDGTIIFRGDTTTRSSAQILNIVQNTIARLPEYQRHGTIELPGALEAIYRQDETMLKEALRRSPHSVNERLPGEKTLLHIALPWSLGVSILLAAGANFAPDNHGDTVLWHACALGQVSSVSLLLDNDIPMDGTGYFLDVCLVTISECKNLDLQKLFVSHLAARRKRLRDFAADMLSDIELQILDLREDRLLDGQTSVVTSVLLRTGVEIPPALAPPKLKSTVYHTLGLNVGMANLLYDAGFRDVDEVDAHGMTPFWAQIEHHWSTLESLLLFAWLRNKGADMYRMHPIGKMMASHAVGSLIGETLLSGNSGGYPIKPQEQARLFLEDSTKNNCRCACSKTGCRTLTSALAACRPRSDPKHLQDSKRVGIEKYLRVLHLVETHSPRNQWIAIEAIRATTFCGLELTHTCHVSLMKRTWPRVRDRTPLSTEEIDEIQEEEHDLIRQLEELVTEFEAKFDELGIPLVQFLEEHWKPRMEEVLEVNSEAKEREERRMRELGIIVRKESGVDEIEDTEGEETDDEDGDSADDNEG